MRKRTVAAVDPLLAARAIAQIHECYDKARAQFPTFNRPYPTVRFDVRGMTAGWAYTNQNLIRLNPVLLNENGDDFINRTPGHEAAHIIANTVYGNSGHGPNWKSVMRFLGLDPSRCHNFDTSNARVSAKSQHAYTCTSCAATVMLGPTRHKKSMQGLPYRHLCAGKGMLVLKTAAVQVTAPPVSNVITFPTPKPKPTRTTTKLEQARAIFAEVYSSTLPLPGRAAMITRLVAEVDMTKAGASTYYQKLHTEFSNINDMRRAASAPK